ncbi:MAG: metallopeptidase family protein [Trueperaceae bacterium]|nr:MAG: metallopeptidase family protein [Trueperaceae bacterium]
MTYREFKTCVEAMLEDIPDEFLRGLQGVHVLEQERPEEDFEDVWRLGEYLDPGADEFLGTNPGLGRHIALYYGSFRRIAEGESGFDWEGEAWETLTHELRHHVESLAGDASLIGEDLRRTEEFKRRE